MGGLTVQRYQNWMGSIASRRANVRRKFCKSVDCWQKPSPTRTFDSVLSGTLGKSLRAMAGEYSGLVHQPASLVGASHTGVVSEAEIGGQRSGVRNLCWDRASGRSG